MWYTAPLLILTDKERPRAKTFPFPSFFLSFSFPLKAEESRSNKSDLNSVNPFINPRGGIGFKASTEPPFQPSFPFLRAQRIQEIRRAGTHQLLGSYHLFLLVSRSLFHSSLVLFGFSCFQVRQLKYRNIISSVLINFCINYEA